ncbi:hypothetical protein [Bacillus mycoides]|uniref:hypothetical protein n=1 Tax=Bacillus mycoides TaxID=1405 RepID=UPI002E1CEE56|nr:hypothetical protein [Bacillus mycoides]
MDIESVLKSLIPLGSALLGGYITYRMNRAKEKKEADKKQLESLFELQKINFKLLSSFTDCLMILDKYALLPTEKEDYDMDKVTRRILECSNELAELNVVSLSHAIHINKDIFKLVKETHVETRLLFPGIQKSNPNMVNGVVRTYSFENKNGLNSAIEKIALLQNTLMLMEEKYVERYIK